MNNPSEKSNYRKLVERTLPQRGASNKDAECEIDALINDLQDQHQSARGGQAQAKLDPVEQLRKRTAREYIPVFMELADKYKESGLSLDMDASNFLQGGREINFEFALGEYRTRLQGTVTTEGIAFHETRYTPEIRGELVSGPMLRLRTLNGEVFRQFICGRLAQLLKAALRRR